jgi:hypothetical protein
MNNFNELDLPVYDLYSELQTLINNNIIEYKDDTDQICINTVEGMEHNYNLGRGSLLYDWDESYYDHKQGKMIVPLRKTPLKEKDFSILCRQFVGTSFEKIYKKLTECYNVGRVRIIISKPKTCMSWHKDDTSRIHLPIKTQEGCLMVIEDQVKHLAENKWYWTNTKVMHTAINASKEDRVHLVATILDK